MAKKIPCKIKGCKNKHRAKGLCNEHYKFSRSTLPNERFWRGKAEAKRRKLKWNLTLDTYIDIISKNCFYCNTSLINWTGVSLDRIDNSKGYIQSNVLGCCGNCNQSRNTFYSIDEFKIMINALLEYRKSSGRKELQENT